MPGLDGTGPNGRGAGTGRGRGACCGGGRQGMGQRMGRMAFESRESSGLEERLKCLERLVAGLVENRK